MSERTFGSTSPVFWAVTRQPYITAISCKPLLQASKTHQVPDRHAGLRIPQCHDAADVQHRFIGLFPQIFQLCKCWFTQANRSANSALSKPKLLAISSFKYSTYSKHFHKSPSWYLVVLYKKTGLTAGHFSVYPPAQSPPAGTLNPDTTHGSPDSKCGRVYPPCAWDRSDSLLNYWRIF